MQYVPFNLDALNLDDIFTIEELTSIDAGASAADAAATTPGSTIANPNPNPGYVDGMQNWMQIP